jgi:hypothetical protein
MTLRERRLAFLQDTIEYYSVDPYGRRSISQNILCKYRTIDGAQCAIGRHIPDDKYDPKIERKSVDKIKNLSHYLPEHILELGLDFLVAVQKIHDNHNNWCLKGLSNYGIERVKLIERSWCS